MRHAGSLPKPRSHTLRQAGATSLEREPLRQSAVHRQNPHLNQVSQARQTLPVSHLNSPTKYQVRALPMPEIAQ
jgi:hypothetical protein